MNAIRKAFERCARSLSLRPCGPSTIVSRTRIRDGLTCEIKEGSWQITADLPVQLGGNGSAPTPGVFGRAALGSSLAVRYMLRAARLHVPITALEVEVQADWDNGALLGPRWTPPADQDVRYIVTIKSTAPEHEVRRVVDEDEVHSRPGSRTVRIVSPSEV